MNTLHFITHEIPKLFPPPAAPVSRELHEYNQRLIAGETLTPEETARAMELMISGRCAHNETAAFLSMMTPERVTAPQLTAMAQVMRAHAIPVTLKNPPPLIADNCGTGGDNLHLFNISTVTMFILAATGIAVAKHGNRASTSQCGSADVLEALGVRIDLGPESVARCIDEAGIGFMFAPCYHPAMKHVVPVRKKLPFRTVFNLLGPLCNPAPVTFQLLGVYHPDAIPLVAETLSLRGVDRSLVVCGETRTSPAWMDEVSLSGPTRALLLQHGDLHELLITPDETGMPPCRIDDLRGGTPDENAITLRVILEGREQGPRLGICLLNAATALYGAGIAASLREGINISREVLNSGAALNKLHQLIESSNSMG